MSSPQRARVFWSGRSQAVRLPKEFRLKSSTVRIHRDGQRLILEPEDDWPEGWVESFAGGADLVRPPQGTHEKRPKLVP